MTLNRINKSNFQAQIAALKKNLGHKAPHFMAVHKAKEGNEEFQIHKHELQEAEKYGDLRAAKELRKLSYV